MEILVVFFGCCLCLAFLAGIGVAVYLFGRVGIGLVRKFT